MTWISVNFYCPFQLPLCVGLFLPVTKSDKFDKSIVLSSLLLSTWARDKWSPCCSVLILFRYLEQIFVIMLTNIFHILDKYILYFGQIYFILWINTCCVLFVFLLLLCQRQVVGQLVRRAAHLIFHNLDKFIWAVEQIHFTIWTNIFHILDKYILQFGQIHFTIWTNTFHNLDKWYSQFGQIWFIIWTNAFFRSFYCPAVPETNC